MKAWALFLLLASFWGCSFVAIKFVVAAVPPLTGAALRVTTALAALSVILLFLGKRIHVPRAALPRLWAAGFFSQALPFALLFYGERTISAGLAGILNGTVPLWTQLFGLAFLLEPESATRRKTAGLILGFAGLLMVFAPKLDFSGSRSEALGAAAVLGMAVSYGAAVLMTRRLLAGDKKVDLHAGAFHQQAASCVVLAAAALLLESPGSLLSIPASAWWATAYLGVMSTALAFLIFYYLIREWGAVSASAVTYVVPMISLAADFVVFGKIPLPHEAAGAVVVLAGVFLIRG